MAKKRSPITPLPPATRASFSKAAPTPTPSQTASPLRVQLSVIHLKGSKEFRDWLSGLSEETHIPAASIVRLALTEWAANHGHKPPPAKA